jgi:hypothetical protein
MSDDPKPPENHPFRDQLSISTLGELSGYAVGIGAVYAAESLCPRQTRACIDGLAIRLGRSRGTSAAAQYALAHKVVDVAVMNLGGFVNMVTQFGLHRRTQPAKERAPLIQDIGRVISGRLAGTVTAVATLALAETFQPVRLARGTQGLSRLLGGRPRLAELALSNMIQSAGALVGNVPAQMLYDRLVGTGKTRD